MARQLKPGGTVAVDFPAVPAPRERWEVLVLPRTSDVTADLRTLGRVGADGWEFVQVSGLEFWLKRRAHG